MKSRAQARPRSDVPRSAPAVESLARVAQEVPALFHRLRAAAARLHQQGEASGGRRGILMEIAGQGPRTVPQMARSRPVSRQHIRMLVQGLAADRLLEATQNPVHRRSPLWRLTPRGARLVEAMRRREARIFQRLATRIDPADLEVTARTLARLRQELVSIDVAGGSARSRR